MHIYISRLYNHWFISWLDACLAPSHDLNPFWHSVNWTLETNFSEIYIKKMSSEKKCWPHLLGTNELIPCDKGHVCCHVFSSTDTSSAPSSGSLGSSLHQYTVMLVPLLLQCWVEVGPSQLATDLPGKWDVSVYLIGPWEISINFR